MNKGDVNGQPVMMTINLNIKANVNNLSLSQIYELLQKHSLEKVKDQKVYEFNGYKFKIEIELEVEAGEKASEVFEAAKKWVNKRIAVERMSDYEIEKARKVIEDKRNHTLAQIEEAEEILAKVKVSDDELPF